MNILFVTPYPPSRIRVRAYGFVEHLRREHAVTILTQVSSAQEQTDVALLQAQGFEVIPVSQSKKYALLRSGLALFGSAPIQVAHARSTQFLHQALQLCENRQFDVIHVEHLRGIASLENIGQKYPVVWDAVDCISDLWRQTAQNGPNIATRMLATLEYKRTKVYEQRLQQKQAQIIAISETDRQALLALTNQKDGASPQRAEIAVIANGVDLGYFHIMEQERRPYNIVFSGKMSYHANVAAALYLCQHIMPLIWQERPYATVSIVGSKPPQVIQNLAEDARIEVTGFVEDMRPYIRRAHVMISPMVYSVGMQNKVLESMALGTPTVISAQSAQALAAQPGRDLLVAASPQDYAQHALHLMRDEQAWTSLSRFGRAYVEQYHNWQAVTNKLVNVYRRAIALHMQEARVPVPHGSSMLSLGRPDFPS